MALGSVAEVRNLDIHAPRDIRTSSLWHQGDILDSDFLRRQFADFRPTHVIHLAARTDLRGATADDYAANTQGVENMVQAIKEYGGVEHAIYASSRLVFAINHVPAHEFDYCPSTGYGASKVVGEQIVRERASAASTWTIVRPTSIWGPWFEEPYRDFFDMVARGRYVTVRGHDPRKSFGYVGNAVHELISFLKVDQRIVDRRVYWLSDYEPFRLSEWAEMVAAALGRNPPLTAPWWAVSAAARIGDLATGLGAKRVPLTSFRLSNLVTDMVYDTSATEVVVGPLPYSLASGVESTVEWYRAHSGSKA